MILFVVLKENLTLNSELIKNIKNQLRTGASPRHVPSIILQTQEIPKTKSGKIVELAVRDLVNGKEVKNMSALAMNKATVAVGLSKPALTLLQRNLQAARRTPSSLLCKDLVAWQDTAAMASASFHA